MNPIALRRASLGLGWLALSGAAALCGDRLSLEGAWRLQLDRADVGIAEHWFERRLSDTVRLPGSLPGQGIGDPVTVDTRWTGGIVDRSYFTAPEFAPYREPGHVKVPFWLQPETYYAGVAWYQRDIEIPRAWAGRRIVLRLERPHWETRVWIGDRLIGTNDSLSTPHLYDLGCVDSGRHQITVRVDNRMVVDIGENSHSISDHTQGNWNGIVGAIRLESTPRVWLDDVQFHPNAARSSVRVKGRIGNCSGAPGASALKLSFRPIRRGRPIAGQPARSVQSEVRWGVDGGSFETDVALGADAPLWDEFDPVLYTVTVDLETPAHRVSGRFGLRDFGVDGTQFTVNGRKTFLRGTLECAIFPKTGHTPTDRETWRRVMRAAKAHGLNNLRFHSHCPPEAAFAAADEEGVYLHVECGTWANQSTTLGDGKPVDAWVYREAERILSAYGNHPSFVMLLYGNEPGGDRHAAYLKAWVEHFRDRDERRLYSSGAGWPQIPENQFHVVPDPRIQAWGGGMQSRINARPPETVTDYRDFIRARPVPVISHEIGQWCVYPNFAEIPKYTGYLKARNFEIFRDSLERGGMLDQAEAFLFASGRLQTLCYKEDIESALRTPGMGGFQLLDLHDFPGQGTVLVGVLDPFWESKGYVTADEYRRFCNSTVPLARLAKRVFTTDEELVAGLEVAHYGPRPIEGATLVWRLVDDKGRALAESTSSCPEIPLGSATPLGSVRVPLESMPAPARTKLVVSIEARGDQAAARRAAASFRGVRFENDWDIWVYPPAVSTALPADVTVTETLDENAKVVLGRGGKVLLVVPPSRVRPDPKRGRIALGFSSIFWNTAWTGRQPPHTLGILCNSRHPAFADFPTDGYSNWQWWYLVSRAGAMILDDLPSDLRPTVQVIDDWFTNRRLGLVFEARVGSGRLLVSSIDLRCDLESNPVARQLRHSLLNYMASQAFRPKVECSIAQIEGLMAPESLMQKLGAKVHRADSAHTGHDAALALDGDPRTMWHTPWGEGAPGFPHEIQIVFERAVRLGGIRLTPRLDGNPNGTIKDYAVYVSPDGQNWSEPVARGTLAPGDAVQAIEIAPTPPVRFVRLVALSGHARGPWASLAEFDVWLAVPEGENGDE